MRVQEGEQTVACLVVGAELEEIRARARAPKQAAGGLEVEQTQVAAAGAFARVAHRRRQLLLLERVEHLHLEELVRAARPHHVQRAPVRRPISSSGCRVRVRAALKELQRRLEFVHLLNVRVSTCNYTRS